MMIVIRLNIDHFSSLISYKYVGIVIFIHDSFQASIRREYVEDIERSKNHCSNISNKIHSMY